jgi:hypothetical protein
MRDARGLYLQTVATGYSMLADCVNHDRRLSGAEDEAVSEAILAMRMLFRTLRSKAPLEEPSESQPGSCGHSKRILIDEGEAIGQYYCAHCGETIDRDLSSDF